MKKILALIILNLFLNSSAFAEIKNFQCVKLLHYMDENEKTISKVVVLAVVSVALSGCVGSNAVTGYLMKFNVKAVDNR